MTDCPDSPHTHPLSFFAEMAREQDEARGHAEDRFLAGMRWLDNLDVEGLLALRWVLSCNYKDAYGNNMHFDGMVTQMLRAKGVDPKTGKPFAAQLLTETA